MKSALTHRSNIFYDFLALTKPRVIALIMITAVVGAVSAGFRHEVNPAHAALALVGIALVAAAAAAFNCMVECMVDSIMQRTRLRPLPNGRLSHRQATLFIILLGGAGLLLTTLFGGNLTGILTGATFFGYACVYTMYLKRATPQNIVIGGATGAMPPLLGWSAASIGQISFEPLLMALIIFVWTPPHFWALAIYRKNDYQRAGLPMLPVTHGAAFTATQIVLYAFILAIVTLLPYLSGMAGVYYLLVSLLANARFIQLSLRLKRSLADKDGRRLFTYSVYYLAVIFAVLLVDQALPQP